MGSTGFVDTRRIPMNIFGRLRLLLMLIALTGCTVFKTSTEFHSGRAALLDGRPDAAVAHFTQVTAFDANTRYSQLQEGAWTYLGRAYYDAKKYPEARQALEKAIAVNSEDSFARLYLGLSLARQGSHEIGQKEVLLGLKGLSDWLDYITYNTFSGVYWDPTGQLCTELQAARSGVQAANPNLDTLFARLESLGNSIEREIDLASRDESRERMRRSGDSGD
jgi:tetratricopeptide (TPR) repeat protein